MPDLRRPDLRHSASIVIARSPQEVYDMVADVRRTGEWSPVCTACWWDDGDGPWAGAWFTGRNRTVDRVWETRSMVVTAERGREFTFCVNGSWVRWSYTFAPSAQGTQNTGSTEVTGGTEVTESWEFLPDGLAGFAARYGQDAAAQVAIRERAARTGIPVTLAALRRVAEAAGDPPDREG